MTTRQKLALLLLAATCVRQLIDATKDHGDLNHLAKIHLGITDQMNRLRNREQGTAP
jgi:hypothetical protein